jgi:hypothetical protein
MTGTVCHSEKVCVDCVTAGRGNVMRVLKITAATMPGHLSPYDCVVAFIVVALGHVRALRILMACGMSHT